MNGWQIDCIILEPFAFADGLLFLAYEMKITESSTLAGQFRGRNFDLPGVTEDGILIRIIELDGWLRIMLEVDDYVTNPSTALRNAAPLVQEWRDRLLEFQGAWIKGGAYQGLYMLSLRQENGDSYKQLAEMINSKVANYLHEYLAYRDEIDERYPEYKASHDQDLYFFAFTTDLHSNSAAISHAKSLLDMFGMNENEITTQLKEGIALIKAGQEPFVDGFPISEFKMRETLRTWRKGKKHKAIKALEQNYE